MKKSLIVGLIFTCVGLAVADVKPSGIYIDKGACPGECCQYGRWTATKDTALMDAPKGKKVIGQVEVREEVRAVTGEVHVHPLKIKASQEDPSNGIHVGDSLLVTTYRGEGSWRVVLQDGRVVELPLDTLNSSQPTQEWWIQIETDKGVTGWTRQSDHFEKQNDCSN